MLNHAQIAPLVPHKGAMCLLDGVRAWSETRIACTARSHLSPENPLRRAGRLAMLCGCEYGLQAAALHGALRAGGACQRAGYVAALQLSRLAPGFLDEASHGVLEVAAELEAITDEALAYGFRLVSGAGSLLLQGRGAIRLPPAEPR